MHRNHTIETVFTMQLVSRPTIERLKSTLLDRPVIDELLQAAGSISGNARIVETRL